MSTWILSSSLFILRDDSPGFLINSPTDKPAKIWSCVDNLGNKVKLMEVPSERENLLDLYEWMIDGPANSEFTYEFPFELSRDNFVLVELEIRKSFSESGIVEFEILPEIGIQSGYDRYVTIENQGRFRVTDDIRGMKEVFDKLDPEKYKLYFVVKDHTTRYQIMPNNIVDADGFGDYECDQNFVLTYIEQQLVLSASQLASAE